MNNDPHPLTYVGTQSQESVNMAAAMAREAARASDAPASKTMGELSETADEVSGAAATAGRKIGEAAGWVAGKATDALQSAAGQVRERAKAAVVTYTKGDPLRALLLAAGTGVLLMALLSMMGRSGVRAVRRSVQR